MSVNQNDLRVIKTKRGLREAFIRLLLQKGYDAISIQDIATEAQAARVTFYRHYKDKEELLVDCLNVIYEELAERMKQVSAEDDFEQTHLSLRIFYEHIQEEEAIYKILFSSRGTQVVIERLRKLFAKRAKSQIPALFPDIQLRVPLDIMAYHSASAHIGLAIWWLEHNKPYSPEYMAQASLWLSMAGNARGLGFEEFAIAPPSIPEIK